MDTDNYWIFFLLFNQIYSYLLFLREIISTLGLKKVLIG